MDRGQGFHYIDQGQQILTDSKHLIAPADRAKIKSSGTFRKFIFEWSMVFHAGTILALLVVLWRTIAKD